MDNFYRAKRTDNGSWIYGIYLPLLGGACMIPDDAAICEMRKKVDGVDIKGHLIETVGIERNTLGLCTGVEDSKQTADNACAHDVVLIEETHEGFRVAADGIFTINAVQFLDNLRANGNSFTVIGNIYDNPEFAEAARHNIA